MSKHVNTAESEKSKSTVIIVSAHKPYRMPADPVYLPVFAGAGGPAPAEWQRDNTGENISEKNPTFCELTALYWAWKNTEADVLGLCHYRRYFGSPDRRGGEKADRLINAAEIGQILETADLILPSKRHYWIETRGSQYAHAHHPEDLRCVEQILAERYPECLPGWKWMLKTRSGHICNMFIMKREQADAYCTWLFDILFEAERRLDISSYSEKDKRVFGYLGERLLDVWIRKNGLKYTEVPMINLERQHWLRKGTAFVRRKLSGKGV